MTRLTYRDEDLIYCKQAMLRMVQSTRKKRPSIPGTIFAEICKND